MRAFLLAAGLGTRLRPITNTRPKALVPIANRPAIVRILDFLHPHGIGETFVNLHFMPEDIKDVVGGGTRWGTRVHYSYEPELLGTAGAIAKIGKFLADDRFVLVNTDIVTDIDLAKALEFHEASGAKVTLVMKEPQPGESFEEISVNADGRILIDWSSKECARCGVYTGVSIFEPSVIDMVPQGYSSLFESILFPLASEGSLYAHFADGYWLDFGTVERYIQANRDVIGGKARMPVDGRLIGDNIWIDETAQIDLTVEIEEPALIGKGVSIERGAKIGPHTVLGKGTTVGPNAVVSNSVVWDGCAIGAFADVDSVVMTEAQEVHRGQRLKRVILQAGISEPVFNI